MRFINMKTGVICIADQAEKDWLPFSEERSEAILGLMTTVLKEAALKQADGYPDDWREKEFDELCEDLQEEVQEVQSELFEIDHSLGRLHIKDIQSAKTEVAHAALVLAFIHDKLNALELELIGDNKRLDAIGYVEDLASQASKGAFAGYTEEQLKEAIDNLEMIKPEDFGEFRHGGERTVKTLLNDLRGSLMIMDGEETKDDS